MSEASDGAHIAFLIAASIIYSYIAEGEEVTSSLWWLFA